MVKLNGISKSFETRYVRTRALCEVGLEVSAGEYVSVQGPSGSGKSTLLSVLGLLELPDEGSYKLDGRELVGLSAGERARVRACHIGFVFQSFNLIGELSVVENVALPLKFAGVASSKRRLSCAEDALERVGLAARRRHHPQQLSGGQQQRVAVARAIVNNPAMLLADEPTGNLDTATGSEVMNLISELNDAGTTVIMITHDPGHASRATRRLVMRDGVLSAAA